MLSLEVVVFENTAVRDVNSGHDRPKLPFGFSPDAASAEQIRVIEKAQIDRCKPDCI